jgi:hypothetical protein
VLEGIETSSTSYRTRCDLDNKTIGHRRQIRPAHLYIGTSGRFLSSLPEGCQLGKKTVPCRCRWTAVRPQQRRRWDQEWKISNVSPFTSKAIFFELCSKRSLISCTYSLGAGYCPAQSVIVAIPRNNSRAQGGPTCGNIFIFISICIKEAQLSSEQYQQPQHPACTYTHTEFNTVQPARIRPQESRRDAHSHSGRLCRYRCGRVWVL